MFRYLCVFFAFYVFRFRLKGEFPKEKKFVIAVVPHTSNLDFLLAIGVRTYLKEPIHFDWQVQFFSSKLFFFSYVTKF